MDAHVDDFAGVIAEAARLTALADALAGQGVRLGRWLAASRHAAVFEAVQLGGAAPGEPLVAKMPWLLAGPVDEHPDVAAFGAGPSYVRLVSATGPFTLAGPADEAEAARLIEAPYAHQRARGAGAPLPRLVRLFTVGGRPVAVHAAVAGHDLAWRIRWWPGRARRQLPALARAVIELHRVYGPHGDLKPEHVWSDFEGRAPVTLIDPLGPLTGEAIGSIGWQLPLPRAFASPLLADLIAVAQIVAACWRDPLEWDGRLAYRLCNLHNGRFAGDVSPAELRRRLPAAARRVPEPWRGWLLGCVDALYAAWQALAERGHGDDGRARDEGWIHGQLAALAAMPVWPGDERG